MNKINQQYEKIKSENRLGIMTHVVFGYPTIDDTRTLIKMMVQEGVDFIEIQIPFSDPLGDGPTIHKANTDVLKNGVNVRDAFTLVKLLRTEDKIEIPLLFMTYMNIPFTYGLEKFCIDAESAGINGLIIPDYNLELEHIDHFDEISKKYNQILIRFISMDSTLLHIKSLAVEADGFIYCFSSRGVTGVRKELDVNLNKHLAQVREYVKKPLAIGFGVSTNEQIKFLKGNADIIVVGSAMIKAFEEGGYKRVKAKLKELIISLK